MEAVSVSYKYKALNLFNQKLFLITTGTINLSVLLLLTYAGHDTEPPLRSQE